jgi:putative transposase
VTTLQRWDREGRLKKLGQTASRRQHIRQMRLSKLHARVANIRKDAAHKLTTGLTRRFETIVIEDLNVSGMAKNHSLAGTVLDCGFHEIRRQFQYRSSMRSGRIVVANRFSRRRRFAQVARPPLARKDAVSSTLKSGPVASVAL